MACQERPNRDVTVQLDVAGVWLIGAFATGVSQLTTASQGTQHPREVVFGVPGKV